MCPRGSASLLLGAVMRTIWQPASIMRSDSATVASTSIVSAVVIDWSTMGASPPTVTPPIRTGRVGILRTSLAGVFSVMG